MIDLTRLDHIRDIQKELRQVFESPSGQEVLKFLEEVAGWYDFSASDRDEILISHGKRQLLATIKTLLDHPAEHVMAVVRKQER